VDVISRACLDLAHYCLIVSPGNLGRVAHYWTRSSPVMVNAILYGGSERAFPQAHTPRHGPPVIASASAIPSTRMTPDPDDLAAKLNTPGGATRQGSPNSRTLAGQR